MHLTPRAWLARADLSLDGFREAVGSRVSLAEAGRTDAAPGTWRRQQEWDGGERALTLPGALGVERTLGDAATVVDVSGERLRSETAATRMKLGLAAAFRWGRYSLGGAVSVSDPGTDDNAYSASSRFGLRFQPAYFP